MVQKYRQPEQEHVTKAVDKLQQEVREGTISRLEEFGSKFLEIFM